ncbi:hypothetical protein L6164_029261 [Bauhinia variegata]|uniref:Uncharacterized protein n=1 Tax=Bauhinia variegata TaxID=167791 RepID=A0ACB9L845_BAUVA|nr:hypothetical protein L6164_029261 [Bauhinia variegata]
MDNTWGWGSIILSITFFLAIGNKHSFCDADAIVNGDDRKVYIIYMGSLPKENYSPSSHHLSMLHEVVGDHFEASLVRSYTRSFNGFAARLTSQETQKLAQMEGVVSIFPSKTLQLQTTRSWDFMGFHEKSQGTTSAESAVIIGHFDTGIWPESKSFSDEGFGPIPKKWKGKCAGGYNFTCNKKIIGARFYGHNPSINDSARDFDGHGSHTASTAAGNKVRDASFFGVARGTARGGVSSARIAVYKVCNPSCTDENLLAAYDDAIADGVDIITLSLGPVSPPDFIDDSVAIGSFHAMAKGILTVNSAGNEGPDRESVESIAPWLLSVAASTIDRGFIDKVSLGDGRTIVGQSINGFTSHGKKFPLIDGVRASYPKCKFAKNCWIECLDPKIVKGKILLCASDVMISKALNYGASGFIVLDETNLTYHKIDPFPLSYVGLEEFQLLQSYVNSTKNPQAEILTSETVKDANAPLVAPFSSRGPNQRVPEIMKPDISAPGVDILAAFSPIPPPSGWTEDKRSANYSLLTGTSMSCPHVAGVAAYIKSFHPDWSPAAIKSSIMTTAKPMNGSEDKEFAYGSGHLNPIEAVNPGLVYDLSRDDYVEMLCNIGYTTLKLRKITGDNSTCGGSPHRSSVRDLNYPAIAMRVHPLQPFKISFRRTVTNVGSANSTYKANILEGSKINITVVPNVLSFKFLKEKQSFVVTIIGEKIHVESIVSSSLIWTDGIHCVRSPIILACR